MEDFMQNEYGSEFDYYNPILGFMRIKDEPLKISDYQ